MRPADLGIHEGQGATIPGRPVAVSSAMCAILGAIVLVSSFLINPAPSPGFSTAQLRDFAIQRHNLIVFGAWLQGMGSLLLVLFAFALVHLAGATRRLAGSITQLAATVILMVSLAEITFYLSAAASAEVGDITSGLVSNALIKAVQHVFLIAPALLLPLGVVLLDSNVLPTGFAVVGLAIGGALQVLGLIGLFARLQPVIDTILIVQALWFVAAGSTLLFRVQAVPSLGKVV